MSQVFSNLFRTVVRPVPEVPQSTTMARGGSSSSHNGATAASLFRNRQGAVLHCDLPQWRLSSGHALPAPPHLSHPGPSPKQCSEVLVQPGGQEGWFCWRRREKLDATGLHGKLLSCTCLRHDTLPLWTQRGSRECIPSTIFFCAVGNAQPPQWKSSLKMEKWKILNQINNKNQNQN